MLDFILDLILPPRCVHCRKIIARGAALCASCAAQVRLNRSFFCGICGRRVPPGRVTAGPMTPVCHPRSTYVLGAAAAYEGPVKSLIRALKFHLVRDAAPELARLMSSYLALLPFEPKEMVVVPLPLSPRRLRERGFDQAELIANNLALHYKLQTAPKALVRVRHGRPQSRLNSKKERYLNIREAYDAGPEDIKGRIVLLIDDVSTSGATLSEAARILKLAGATKVLALVAAKA